MIAFENLSDVDLNKLVAEQRRVRTNAARKLQSQMPGLSLTKAYELVDEVALRAEGLSE